MFESLQDVLILIISSVVINIALLTLFVCSLYHHFIGSLFNRKQRDVRGADSEIENELLSNKTHTRNVSTSTLTPLNGEEMLQPYVVEEDVENNIEFDHTITKVSENPFVTENEDMKLVAKLNYYYNQYNISIREFEVETDDGFILDLWHMEDSSGVGGGDGGANKPVVLLLHGLLQSAGSFASSGKKSLAYYLFEQGFDVWLGNNRCGLEIKYNKNKIKDKKTLWDWDIKHMAFFDLKCLITNVLGRTNREKLTLIAHSQGTTQTFYGLINDNEFNDFKLGEKLNNFVALAPAIYPGPLFHEKVFVKLMTDTIDNPFVFGKKSFMPMMMDMRNLMVGSKLFSFLSFVMFNFLFDWNDQLWDPNLRDRHFLFSPVHISVQLMQWWLSPDPDKLTFKNGFKKIFQVNRSWFPINESAVEKEDKSTKSNEVLQHPNILLFVPRQDRLVDGKKLINHFIQHEDKKLYKIWYIDEYSHLDVLWADDVIDRIGVPILQSLRY